MKFYLDTNILRQVNKIPKEQHSNLMVSYLGVFETISGIKSEKEYEKRKSILNTLIKNDISIIWESQKSITSDAFSLGIIDDDIEATRLMMEKTIASKSYADFKNISFEHCGNTYTIDIFVQHDKNVSQDTVKTIEKGSSAPTKEQRAEYRSQPLSEPEIQIQTEFMVVDFLVNQLGIAKFSEQYYLSIESFFEKNKLRNYMKYLTIYIIDSIKLGRVAGKNDGFDLSHLVYSDDVEYFVSDDKFYKRIDEALFKTRFLTFNGFIEQIQEYA